MKQIGEATPAYVAYRKLKTIPKNAPLFDRTINGGAVVHEGEIFCRLPGLGSRICGAKCGKDQDHLPYHMEQMTEPMIKAPSEDKVHAGRKEGSTLMNSRD